METCAEDRKACRVLTVQCIVDIIIWIAVGLPTLFLFLMGVPSDRGFFCDDQSLMYPYLPEIITTPVLLLAGFGLSIIVIFLVEFLNWLERRRKPCFLGNRDLPGWVKGYAVFLVGFVLDQIFIETIKNQVGKLRPNFFSVCKPVYDSINCTKRYVTEYRCTSEEHAAGEIRESRQSFPSGHAAFSMYISIYFCLYVQQRLDITYSHTLKFILQTALVMTSVLCGLSRIQDNMHHPTDVIAGFVLGTVVAVAVYQTVARRVLTVSPGRLRLNIERSTGRSGTFGNGVSSSPGTATTLLPLFQNDMTNGVPHAPHTIRQADKDVVQNGRNSNSNRPLSVT